DRVLRYTAGEDFALDQRLVRYDVQASIAHAEMLHEQKLLAEADLEAIRHGLTALCEEHARGEWHIELADEDGQTALERRLTERIGAAGGRVHLGRSRNDQVLTALRLYLQDVARELGGGALGGAEALERLRQREKSTALPGCRWIAGRLNRSSGSPKSRSRSPRCNSHAARQRRASCSRLPFSCRTWADSPPTYSCSTHRSSPFSSCPKPSPPAPPSCRRSVTRTSSSSSAGAPPLRRHASRKRSASAPSFHPVTNVTYSF